MKYYRPAPGLLLVLFCLICLGGLTDTLIMAPPITPTPLSAESSLQPCTVRTYRGIGRPYDGLLIVTSSGKLIGTLDSEFSEYGDPVVSHDGTKLVFVEILPHEGLSTIDLVDLTFPLSVPVAIVKHTAISGLTSPIGLRWDAKSEQVAWIQRAIFDPSIVIYQSVDANFNKAFRIFNQISKEDYESYKESECLS